MPPKNNNKTEPLFSFNMAPHCILCIVKMSSLTYDTFPILPTPRIRYNPFSYVVLDWIQYTYQVCNKNKNCQIGIHVGFFSLIMLQCTDYSWCLSSTHKSANPAKTCTTPGWLTNCHELPLSECGAVPCTVRTSFMLFWVYVMCFCLHSHVPLFLFQSCLCPCPVICL